MQSARDPNEEKGKKEEAHQGDVENERQDEKKGKLMQGDNMKSAVPSRKLESDWAERFKWNVT